MCWCCFVNSFNAFNDYHVYGMTDNETILITNLPFIVSIYPSCMLKESLFYTVQSYLTTIKIFTCNSIKNVANIIIIVYVFISVWYNMYAVPCTQITTLAKNILFYFKQICYKFQGRRKTLFYQKQQYNSHSFLLKLKIDMFEYVSVMALVHKKIPNNKNWHLIYNFRHNDWEDLEL